MKSLERQSVNAVITSAEITMNDGGFLDCWLTLKYGGAMVQRFGGWALYLPKSCKHHSLLSVAGHHIHRIMEIAGVTKWSQVVGKPIRVNAEHAGVHSIGHIIDDDWYFPSQDFERARMEASDE